jgi:hypothetical protein
MLIDDFKPDPKPDDDFKEFQRTVLKAMGLPATKGGLRIAVDKGVDFQRLWEGVRRRPERIKYCWREVYNQVDDECPQSSCFNPETCKNYDEVTK